MPETEEPAMVIDGLSDLSYQTLRARLNELEIKGYFLSGVAGTNEGRVVRIPWAGFWLTNRGTGLVNGSLRLWRE